MEKFRPGKAGEGAYEGGFRKLSPTFLSRIGLKDLGRYSVTTEQAIRKGIERINPNKRYRRSEFPPFPVVKAILFISEVDSYALSGREGEFEFDANLKSYAWEDFSRALDTCKKYLTNYRVNLKNVFDRACEEVGYNNVGQP